MIQEDEKKLAILLIQKHINQPLIFHINNLTLIAINIEYKI